jgi:flagellar motor switch protein FliN
MTNLDDLAVLAAEAAADVLPAVEPLTAGPAQPGSPHVTAAFAGAAIATLDGIPGRIAVLVGAELVEALAGSPLGGLDVAAATQPALDAAALALGARAQAAQTVELTLVVGDLGGEFVTVPLIGAGIAGALLIPTTTLNAARPGQVPPAGLGTGPVLSAAEALLAEEEGQPPGSGIPLGMAAFGGAPEPTEAVPGPRLTAVGNGFMPAERGIEMLHGVDMEVTVELGRTRMTVRDLLALSPGAVLELDRAAGSPADLLVNGRLIARGEVVVVDEDFGLRVTEILDAAASA